MTDTANNRLPFKSDEIYLDPVFEVILKIHSHMKMGTDFVQRITKAASYKLIMGIICSILFGIYAYMAVDSLNKLNRSYEILIRKETTLSDIVANHTHKEFWEDQRLFFVLNEEYLWNRYQLFSEFIKGEFSNLKIQHPALDDLMDIYATLNIVITSFPFLLNSPWWTNACTITVAVLSKYAPKQSLHAALTMIILSLSLGSILLLVHFVNLLFFAVDALKTIHRN